MRAAPDYFHTTYTTLRQIASNHLRKEAPGHTLQPTALVHEAYLRLSEMGVAWEDRTRFLATASRMIRQILVDHARRRAAHKRAGDVQRIALTEDLAVEEQRSVELIDLDEALHELARNNAAIAQVVEFRFFARMTITEIADAMDRSERTIRRDLTYARSWLRRALSSREKQDDGHG